MKKTSHKSKREEKLNKIEALSDEEALLVPIVFDRLEHRMERKDWWDYRVVQGYKDHCIRDGDHPDEFLMPIRRYINLAKGLRRQVLEQLAKPQGAPEQGELF